MPRPALQLSAIHAVQEHTNHAAAQIEQSNLTRRRTACPHGQRKVPAYASLR